MTSKLRIFTLMIASCLGLMTAKASVADTIISLVNFYPGSEIYELEGHSVIRITMPGSDVAVSYGTYNFNQPNFVYRFVKGETDYWVTAIPWDYVVDAYTREGRRIVGHEFKLNSDQKRRLIDLLNDNLQEENRTYRYNYVKDNCATRPLAMIEAAIGDSIVLANAPSPLDGEQTFRSIMRHFNANYPWYQFGIDLALGSGIDYKLNEREKSFAPALLDGQLAGATVNGEKIVAQSNVLNDVAPDAAIDGPTPWYARPMTVCVAILLLVAGVSLRDIRRRRLSRWLDCVMYSVFALAGCLITFLVFISVHEATSPNILLLWLNPFCFIPAIFIWINRCRLIIFSYQIVNFVALMVLLAMAVFGSQQLNLAFYPLIIADAIRSITYIYINIKHLKCQK